MRHVRLALALACASLAAERVAGAHEEEGDPPLVEAEGDRPLPSYQGGRAREDDSGEAALWIPRALAMPLYLATEYLVRLPFETTFGAVERRIVSDKSGFWLSWDRREHGGMVPLFCIDVGVRPSIGAALYWRNAGGSRLDADLSGAFGGVDWGRISHRIGLDLGARGRLTAEASYATRPDRIFYGVGTARRRARFRYGEERGDVGLAYAVGGWRSSGARLSVGIAQVDVDPAETSFDDPSLAQGIAAGAFPPPPGIEPFRVLWTSLTVALDSRQPRGRESPWRIGDHLRRGGSGIRLAARATYSGDLRGNHGADRRSWIGYGGDAAGYVDLTGTWRVLGLVVTADLADPLGDGEVPFTELPSLGGSRALVGFLERRLIGRSAAAAVVEYRWPIWWALDGRLHYGAGDAFDARFEGFRFERLRSSFGVGVSSVPRGDYPFDLLLAFGTEPFGDGGEVDAVRFVLAITEGT